MYLLDTSAILAHCYADPGSDLVERILAERQGHVAAVTWFELRMKLRDEEGGPELMMAYAESIAGTVDITREVADAAFALRHEAGVRIPAADCLIAAAARIRGFELVHRNAHLGAIPVHLVAHTMLPPKR
ncbi:MAG: PIN domain-containing protein [Bryobacteraceae bacterium]|nr:PIN domain-containing protein [Bryobacteraceae bacterium]